MPAERTKGSGPYLASWAGYDSQGMDYHGHMHIHPDGNFTRYGGGLGSPAVGFYCAAPLTEDGACSDPSDRVLKAFDCTPWPR
jgi:hypothetical protein